LAEDRTEMNNLVDQEPKRAKSMLTAYEKWAERIGAHNTEESMAMPLNQQDRYLYEEEMETSSTNE